MSCNFSDSFVWFRYTDGLKDIDPDQVDYMLIGASDIASKKKKNPVMLFLFLFLKRTILAFPVL